MRTVHTAAALAAAAFAVLCVPGVSAAQSSTTYSIGLASEYVFRGISQTDENPAIQGSIDWTSGAIYAGAWASNVDFGDDTEAEIDLYGGVRGEAAGLSWDVGVIGYLYADAPPGADYNYAEIKIAASRGFGPATIGAAIYATPDFFGIDEEAVYAEINGAYQASDEIAFSGAIGRQSLDVTDDYWTWNAGVTAALTEGVGLDVRYHDTDVDGPLSERRITAAIKYAF